MRTFASLASGLGLTALMTLTGPAHAATFVYVSNAEDGTSGPTPCCPTAAWCPARASRPGSR